jgi:hypothetical protein
VSVPVPVEGLRDALSDYGTTAYVLTTGRDGRPKVASVEVAWAGDRLEAAAGDGSRANAADRPLVTLLWPPPEPGGYTLIVDASAEVDHERLVLTPTKGVLHRPAASPDHARACGSDCRPLT